MIPIVIGAHGTIGKRSGSLRDEKTSEDHPDYSIIEIGLNTEKIPGDLKGTCSLSNFSERPSAYTGVKNSQ